MCLRRAGTAQLAIGSAADGGRRLALVLGSEGQGVSPEILGACHCISIPMAGDMESLNVAVAGSILMWALSDGSAPFMESLSVERANEQHM